MKCYVNNCIQQNINLYKFCHMHMLSIENPIGAQICAIDFCTQDSSGWFCDDCWNKMDILKELPPTEYSDVKNTHNKFQMWIRFTHPKFKKFIVSKLFRGI